MSEQAPELQQGTQEQAPRETFFGPDKTPTLHRALVIPNENIGECKTEFNHSVEKIHERLRFKIPAHLEDGLDQAHAALDRIRDALISTTEDPRTVLNESGEYLGGPTSELYMTVYNTFAEALPYYDTLEKLTSNK